MTQRVAIIQFPGSNCEYETQSCVKAAGLDVDIISWNTADDTLKQYAGFILPGGFSFQDRVRAGVVSSKLPVVSYLKKVAEEGVPILGICNGCQILAESGIVPNITGDASIDVALAPNVNDGQAFGFVCDWVYCRFVNPQDNVFTRGFSSSTVLPIQVNHGEGNITFKSTDSFDQDKASYIQYCSQEGHVEDTYPTNPNGADFNVAGLSNAAGNVLALMPHPERGSFLYQIPRYLDHEWSDKKREGAVTHDGPWLTLFQSMANYIKERQ